MTKTRILWCGESSHIKSGFGNYTRCVLQYLYNTGKYEIAELSGYRDASVPKIEPWTVFPVAVKKSDPLFEKYNSNPHNQFGQWRFDLAVLKFKPHIVIDVRDYWNFVFQETSPLRPFYHWLICPTYDSSPPIISALNGFHNADTLCFHTEWAMNDLKNNLHYKANNIGGILNDAVDHTVFKPLNNKNNLREKLGLPKDAFIVGSVMRNQKRKLIPDILETFSNLCKIKKDKNLILYLHTSYPDALAWDIPSLLIEYNITDKVWFTYTCRNCEKSFSSVYQGDRPVCRKCLQKKCCLSNVKHGTSPEELAEIYNTFDIYLQYAICEGFGIPPVEAAACGIHVVTMDHEAMGEVGKKINATLVPIKTMFRELETNAKRALPDNDYLLEVLLHFIDNGKEKLEMMGQKAHTYCKENFCWTETAKKFEKLIDNIDINQKLSWNAKERVVNTNINVNSGSGFRNVLHQVVNDIIKDPFLQSTEFIENLIKNSNDGVVHQNGIGLQFDIQKAIKILEMYMMNKVSIETLRTNNNLGLKPELTDFLNYGSK